ncbi:hypothetical protein [Bradyrhizobium sp. SK17]|uniref:hypothetical protein n=1 Tax=Bradyrhizobium sp. SK17 TaxID=2057741 RepID=UPI0012FDDEB2|nr:hypothetical protein [Bradyrhizobium sp. SK17]
MSAMFFNQSVSFDATSATLAERRRAKALQCIPRKSTLLSRVLYHPMLDAPYALLGRSITMS